MVHTKSAREPRSPSDGLRLCVTRYWPRGHAKEEYDAWLPNLAPSETLLHDFLHERITWAVFSRRYREEMLKGYGAEPGKNTKVKNSGQKHTLKLLRLLAARSPVTLICSCAPEQEHCHRHLLRQLVEDGD